MNILTKTFLYFIVVITFATILSACDSQEQNKTNNSWQKVGENLYFDKASLSKVTDDIVSGKFKEYFISKKCEKYPDAYYQMITVTAYCNIKQQNGLKKLEYPIYEYYDKTDKFLGENNIHEYWRKHYPGGHLGITYAENEINGEIYFNILCKK